METDINVPKSRTFNMLLRFFQLGLCLCATFFVGLVFRSTCAQKHFEIIKVMGLMMLIVNFSAMLFVKFRNRHHKTGFVIFYTINLIECITIIVFSAINYEHSVKCPTKTLFYVYYLSNIPVYLILSGMILFLPFYWVQRISNSPGSVVWSFIFFFSASKSKYLVLLVIIGLISLLTNLLTWVSNGLAFLNGVSTALKKLIGVSFIIGIVLTGINEVLALIAVFSVRGTTFDDIFIKRLLEVFVFINVIDLAFWILGLMSLQYENGDVIRDGLFQYGVKDEPKQMEDDNEFDIHYGTLK